MSDNKRRALGRGLGALIPGAAASEGARPVDVFFNDDRRDGSVQRNYAAGAWAPGRASNTPDGRGDGSAPELVPVSGARFEQLPVQAIRPNHRQPRTAFDEDELAELTHSIREIGVLQPVVVRELEQGAERSGKRLFELVMGERRWRATMLAGLDTIPAIIRETQDDALLRDALLENLHRSQLNPLDEAAAYQQLLEDFGGTHEELADRLGRSRPQVSNTIRLLRLPPLVARRVAAGVLSAGHARALLALDDGAAMERLAQRIVAEGLSVRSVEEIVAVGDGSDTAHRQPRRSTEPAPELADLASRLSDRLDTRVRIAMGQRRGRLSVEFASVADLHRIFALLTVEAAAPDSRAESAMGDSLTA